MNFDRAIQKEEWQTFFEHSLHCIGNIVSLRQHCACINLAACYCPEFGDTSELYVYILSDSMSRMVCIAVIFFLHLQIEKEPSRFCEHG